MVNQMRVQDGDFSAVFALREPTLADVRTVMDIVKKTFESPTERGFSFMLGMLLVRVESWDLRLPDGSPMPCDWERKSDLVRSHPRLLVKAVHILAAMEETGQQTVWH